MPGRIGGIQGTDPCTVKKLNKFNKTSIFLLYNDPIKVQEVFMRKDISSLRAAALGRV